ncbi:MAG: thermonuclease family protein [Parvularculaceae bacterium]|nr:thermonuclease family protein [Parvularculaceae bacterium]
MDIIAPTSPLSPGAADEAARKASLGLVSLFKQGLITIPDTAPVDRWGRAIGPVSFRFSTGAKTTLQEALLCRGWARVFPQSNDHVFLDRCFAAEDEARALRRGLWALPNYQVRSAKDLSRAYGLQIYQGRVFNASEGRGRIYINFGEDFRIDLTATVTKGDFRRWRSKDPVSLYAGRTLEIRGYVETINGPSIELRHERQLRRV